MSVEIVENLINSWAQTFRTDTKKSHNESCGYLWGGIRKAGTGPRSLKEKLHLILPGFLRGAGETARTRHVCRQQSTARALPVGSMGTVLSVSMSLLGCTDISRAFWSSCTALRGHQHPHGPCRVSKLGWKETPLRRHKELLHHRKLPSSTKEQNHCVTSVANLSVGHRGSWVLPPPPSGALLLMALSAHQRAVSNVQRGRKLCEAAEHHERIVHFPLEMGY